MTDRYWFARRFPLSDARKSVSPVSWEGYAVALGFVGGLMLAGVLYLALTTAGQAMLGMIAFVVVAILSGGFFIVVSRMKADMTRTVEDYRTGRIDAS